MDPISANQGLAFGEQGLPTEFGRRTDRDTANKVRSGLVVLGIDGPRAAADWMCARGVPLEVAHKVITRPNSRRKEDAVVIGRWWRGG